MMLRIQDREFDNTRQIIPEEIKTRDNITIHLQGIVIHSGGSIKGGHYTAYVKGQYGWWFVNVLPASITAVGNFEALMQHNDEAAMTRGTIALYATE